MRSKHGAVLIFSSTLSLTLFGLLPEDTVMAAAPPIVKSDFLARLGNTIGNFSVKLEQGSAKVSENEATLEGTVVVFIEPNATYLKIPAAPPPAGPGSVPIPYPNVTS